MRSSSSLLCSGWVPSGGPAASWFPRLWWDWRRPGFTNPWPHHWVWLVPGVACAVALAVRGFRQGQGQGGLAAGDCCRRDGIPALIQLRFHLLEIMLATKSPGISFAAAFYALGGVVLVIALGVGARLIARGEGTGDDVPPGDNVTGVVAGA